MRFKLKLVSLLMLAASALFAAAAPQAGRASGAAVQQRPAADVVPRGAR